VFRKLLRFTAFLSFPAMFGLALVSREFILLTIGAQWLDSIPMLQILCLSGAFLPFYSLYQNVTITAGKSNIYMWCNICQILIQLAMIATLYQQGIIVLISVYSAFTVLWLLVWQMIAQKLIGIKFIDALKDTIPFMFISLAVMAATYYLTSAITNHILLLFSRVLLAGLLYVLIMRLTGAKVFEECINFILKRQPAK
jgi:O-antigen/teichoic acid export membrane protein